ncbi:MAG TPA: DUF1573 domain-containing protein [Sunxiuqinia sp.]|nr:DUF1573 domain-containing protein [Sunxiuqinia sp.]
MKTIVAILLILLGVACQNSESRHKKATNEINGTPKFEFQEEFHNFGSLEAGEVVAYNFKFTNTGDGTLHIKKAEAECGCLTVNFPKKGIAPGQSDFIEVVFNSAGETGTIYKDVVLFSNAAEANTKLTISAQVKNEVINLYSKN